MKRLTSLASVTLAVALLAPSSDAQPPLKPGVTGDTLELYRLDLRLLPPEKSRPQVADAVEQFRIELDPAAVASDPRRFELDLPDGARLEARRTRSVVYNPAWMSWSGDLHRQGLSAAAGGIGYVHLVYHGDQVTGILNFESERYQIAGSADGGHRLVRLSDRRVPVCALETSPHPATAAGLRIAPPAPSGTVAPSTKALVRVDVMALYTDDFLSSPAAELAVRQFIQTSVSIANDAFARSGVNAFYNLVHSGPIQGAPPSTDNIFRAIGWLDAQLENPATAAAMQRETFGADMVALVIPFDPIEVDVCGIAILPEYNSDMTQIIARRGSGVPSSAFGDRAYSVHRSGCGLNDFTFAHELGHNYGMRHETENDASEPHLFAFGRGYDFVVSGQDQSSIMGCACGGANEPPCDLAEIGNAVCDRVPHFSNPSINYQGVPTGVAPSPQDAGRNNAQVANVQTAAYALFRAPACATPPDSGDWIVTENCTLEGPATAPANVIVQNNATFTISNGALLNIDFTRSHLLVRDGSRVIVKVGGRID